VAWSRSRPCFVQDAAATSKLHATKSAKRASDASKPCFTGGGQQKSEQQSHQVAREVGARRGRQRGEGRKHVISCELTRLSLAGVITYAIAVEKKFNIMKAAASRRSPEENFTPKPAPRSGMGRSMDKGNAEVFFF
jgi:hypothetical protein